MVFFIDHKIVFLTSQIKLKKGSQNILILKIVQFLNIKI
jgi:hypothetical protein